MLNTPEIGEIITLGTGRASGLFMPAIQQVTHEIFL